MLQCCHVVVLACLLTHMLFLSTIPWHCRHNCLHT